MNKNYWNLNVTVSSASSLTEQIKGSVLAYGYFILPCTDKNIFINFVWLRPNLEYLYLKNIKTI